MGNGAAASTGQRESVGASGVELLGRQQRVIPIADALFAPDAARLEAMLREEDLPRVRSISRLQSGLMRGLDVIGAGTGLLLLWPLLLVVAAAIKIDSKGPVIYRQKRVGQGGRVFTLYKFRTMVAHAERLWGLLPASEDDERVTAVGRLLRQTRLDELPQLFNVLKGDMSLVGPRPENLYRVHLHEALRGVRLAVKPGITGLAQIRSLYDLKPEHKLRYDYLYIQKRSFWLNLYILAMTIPVMVKKSGW